ncbi:cytochrome C oxidase subunit IV family protein [Alkalihalobacillus sp. AL-G]|uniref:cytochrome C oxidase subunit IV family protein n=1 Tax=Alkalihalobacillus sp. AL-G TaxID=2926399 RepID=UPI00272B15D3|nr:cytochrome C oxidase subunit IV family protein [Alkalihalobacillus sp. AL-G]WLD95031.1 cytochrome C oxidase subunit IV family protein [Alkalihalobacillus sp. AL-G]
MAGNDQTNSVHRHSSLQKKIKLKQERRQHNVSFVMMILLTIVAFAAINSDAVSDGVAILFILVLAGLQVFFQLYIWMHLGHKGHEFPMWGIASGLLIAALTVGTLMGLIW